FLEKPRLRASLWGELYSRYMRSRRPPGERVTLTGSIPFQEDCAVDVLRQERRWFYRRHLLKGRQISTHDGDVVPVCLAYAQAMRWFYAPLGQYKNSLLDSPL